MAADYLRTKSSSVLPVLVALFSLILVSAKHEFSEIMEERNENGYFEKAGLMTIEELKNQRYKQMMMPSSKSYVPVSVAQISGLIHTEMTKFATQPNSGHEALNYLKKLVLQSQQLNQGTLLSYLSHGWQM